MLTVSAPGVPLKPTFNPLDASTSVKLPAAAVFAPITVPSISPPSISAVLRVPRLVILGWAAVCNVPVRLVPVISPDAIMLPDTSNASEGKLVPTPTNPLEVIINLPAPFVLKRISSVSAPASTSMEVSES